MVTIGGGLSQKRHADRDVGTKLVLSNLECESALSTSKSLNPRRAFSRHRAGQTSISRATWQRPASGPGPRAPPTAAPPRRAAAAAGRRQSRPTLAVVFRSQSVSTACALASVCRDLPLRRSNVARGVRRAGSRSRGVRGAGGAPAAGAGPPVTPLRALGAEGARTTDALGASECVSRALGLAWRGAGGGAGAGSALDAVEGAAGGAGASGALAAAGVAMTVQREEGRAPRTRFMITDILDGAPRDLSAHRDSDSDRSATDSPGRVVVTAGARGRRRRTLAGVDPATPQ
ncbi:hypothetical protein EVAR_53636_1 [Eumeta japonica]|uniref:Uncharacterized protein n=1 Tax=Eumeta variegata TaxID=151549 RepID=A0A4C1X0U0_EUMVA|nr:hypothetical protein EVAR_53636_1 [Eumeta japonica]